MEEILIKKIDLNNGLTLEFIDVSRKVAGDRYQVTLKTRVAVPVEAKWFPENDPALPGLGDIIKKVGPAVAFEQKKVRNFVDEKEKPAVLKDIMTVAEDFGVRYIGHPDFPRKLILKKYHDKK
jgi:hypothetical protein